MISILASIPLFFTILGDLAYRCYGYPLIEIRFSIDQSDQITLLAITIALAAYIATVRLALLGRLGDGRKFTVMEMKKKKKIQCILLYLIPVDINFLLSAFAMSLIIFFPDNFGGECLLIGIKSFVVNSLTFSIVYLAILHFSAWVSTFNSTFK